MSVEARLLLACARLQLEPAHRDQIRQRLAGEIDWDVVLQQADYHGLRPLLFRHLQTLGAERVPRPVYAQLWGRHEALLRHNQAMADELRFILDLLESQGIPALPYKGPMLALAAYGDLALREFGDLDLLLRPADVLGAKAALQASGFRPEYPLPAPVEKAFLRSRANYHLVMLRDQPRAMVELHWKTDPEFPVEPVGDEAWWQGLASENLGELRVRCFSPEESVLVLILHGSKHFWASLGWLVDVAELVRKQPELDWHWIIDRAERLRGSRRLALGLQLLHDLLEVGLPTSVLGWLAGQESARKQASRIGASVLDPQAPDPGSWQRMQWNFELYESWPQRLRHASDVILSPSLIEWSQWSLPRPLFFLYPPMRVLRLLGRRMAAKDRGA